MSELLAVVWQKGRVVSFVLTDSGDITRHDLIICPHCECVLGSELEPTDHIAECGGSPNDA